MAEKRSRGAPRGIRPHTWYSGPDEYKHSMYKPWMLSKAQANFRKEEWLLSFEEYYEMWKNDWNNRGRDPDDVCMTRYDPDGPWSVDNAYIITRREHLQIQGRLRKGMRYGGKPPYTKLKVQK